MYPVSAFCFTKNTFKGGWPLFEAIANALCVCDDVYVADIGSDDNTFEVLQKLANKNKRLNIVKMVDFPYIDAGVFAEIPNYLQTHCKHDNLMYFQSDEIWHENLLKMTEEQFKKGNYNLSFWRYHLRENAQLIRQFPQRVHRVGRRGGFEFIDDGMNTNTVNDAPLCSNFHGGWFSKWGDMFKDDPPFLPTWEMIFDGGLIGMFLDCVYARKEMHQPFWRDGMNMPYWGENGHEERVPIKEWFKNNNNNLNWIKTQSPFNIPAIMKPHLGKKKYYLTPAVKFAILEDKCRELILT